jgi:hypothetical protein
MSVDELMRAVDSLSEPDLENLLDRVLFTRARRKAPVLSHEETVLLLEINQGMPSELHNRYEVLATKRDDDALTEAEYAELLDVGDRMEGFGVKRLESLIKLATIRQVPLPQLMTDLGIQSPGVR